ncbi:hypothetical protein [Neorhizobium sp. NCHU2750]|uniref:hypothetical protein n=1 Tax=Neorhizobium sp. NCHU2750 TaxID=1825976 RepID=UPI0013C468B5
MSTRTNCISGKRRVSSDASCQSRTGYEAKPAIPWNEQGDRVSGQFAKVILDHRMLLVELARRQRRTLYSIDAIGARRHGDEDRLRQAIIQWQPSSHAEAYGKLAYLGSVIVASGRAFRDDELHQIHQSIAAYL